MAETFTFLATRGSIQTYAGGTLKAIALDATVIDNEDPGVNNVTDIESAEVTGGTYTRPTLTGNSWDTSGAWPSLLADDLLVEGLDDTVGTVAVFDNASGTLLFGVRFDPVAVTGDLPINWPGGVAVTVEPPASLALDDLTDVDTTGVAAGDALVWDGTEWVPEPVDTVTVDQIVAADAIDGTGDAFSTLFRNPGTAAAGDVPAGWSVEATYDSSEIAGVLAGAGPSGLKALLPETAKVYHLTSDNWGDPFVEVPALVARYAGPGGDERYLLAGGTVTPFQPSEAEILSPTTDGGKRTDRFFKLGGVASHAAGAFTKDAPGDVFTEGFFAVALVKPEAPGDDAQASFGEILTQTHDAGVGAWNNFEWAFRWRNGRPYPFLEWTEEGDSAALPGPQYGTGFGCTDGDWHPPVGQWSLIAVSLEFDVAGQWRGRHLRQVFTGEDLTAKGWTWKIVREVTGTTGPTSIDSGVTDDWGIGYGTSDFRVAWIGVWDGPDGVSVFDLDPQDATSSTSIEDSEGDVWTAGAEASIAVDAVPYDSSGSTDASALTTGTLAFARLPIGTTSTTVRAGNDAAYSDARTPTAHKTTHATGGSDALAPSDIGAVPTSRTIAGLDLTSDRDAAALRAALALGTAYPLDSDTDAALAAASDSKVATQKATKSYVDARFPIHRSATTSRRISTKGSFNTGAAEGMTTTGDRVYAPIFLPAGTYNTLSVRSTTAGTSTWRLGIFNGASGDPTQPGTVLKDAGTIDLSVTAAMLTLSSLNFTIPADGWYWCCAQVETYTSAPQLVCAHADSKTDLLFPGWPGQEGNYLRAYCGYHDLSPSAGALTTANAITGNASTGLDYAGNVPRFWVGP